MRTPVQMDFAMVALLVPLSGLLCDPYPALQNNATFIGEDDSGLFYRDNFYVGVGPSDEAVIRAELTDGSTTTMEGTIPYTAEQDICDGEYAAWVEEDAKIVVIEQLVTGDRKQVSVDSAWNGRYTAQLCDIDTGRLLISYPVTSRNDSFKIVDMATAAVREVAAADWVYSAVLDGENLSFLADAQKNVDLLAFELAVRLEVINLDTGEDKVVIEGMRVPEWPGLKGGNGKLVWERYRDGGFTSYLQAYDLTEKKLSTLVNDFGNGDGGSWVADFDGQDVLAVQQARGKIIGGISIITGPTKLNLIDLDGQSTTIASMPGTIAQTEFTDARLIGHFAVWQGFGENQLYIYNLHTKTTHTQPLFTIE